MRFVLAALVVVLLLPGCCRKSVSVKSLLGMEKVEVTYLREDGTWICADSLSWTDRSWYRELRFDTDGDGKWNYLYGEVYDDVAGWIWIPTSVRINPEEEPELAKQKEHLVGESEDPPCQPSLDDFGYKRK